MEIFRKLEVRIRYAIWALGKINSLHLGEIVEYNGVKCSVINGVSAPRWKLLPLTDENLARDKREIWDYVHQDEMIISKSFKSKLFRYRQSYSFQMCSWYSIDYRTPMFSRISFLNKNNIAFR